MNVRAHLLISGRVQGVWYRASTKEKAAELGVVGWVKNTSDGKVEAVFEGTKEYVDRMIDWCYQGPPLAHVTEINVSYESFTGEFSTFTVKYLDAW